MVTTANFGWDIGFKGKNPWWEIWDTLWDTMDTKLYYPGFPENVAPIAADLLITIAGEKVTIGNLFRNIPDGTAAAPSIARAAKQTVGLYYIGNTLICQNNEADGSWPLLITSSNTGANAGIGYLYTGTNIIGSFMSNRGFVTRNPVISSGDMSATLNTTTGVITWADYGETHVPEGGMFMGVSDVYAPTYICATMDSTGQATDSLHFLGRLLGQGELGSVPNFQIDRYGNIDIYDSSTLGTENLNEGNFTTHVNWDTTGDFNDTAGNAKYTHNTGSGTLTQVAADLAVALKGNRWYKLVYTVSGVVGSPTASIPDTVAQLVRGEAWADRRKLRISNGVAKIIMFKTIANPTDFIINGASTTATHSFTLDDLSLKEIQDGDINICGKLYFSSFQVTTGAAAGTLTNAPTIGDPEGYLKVVIDGAEKAIPYWDVP